MSQILEFHSLVKTFNFFNYNEPEKKKWEPFSLGLCCSQLQEQGEESWRLKIFRVVDKKNQKTFDDYISEVSDFAEMEKYCFKTNFLFQIVNHSFSQKTNEGHKDFFIIQKIVDKNFLLKSRLKGMCEIDAVWVIRNIVSLYSHLFTEEKLTKYIKDLGVLFLDIDEICYYRKLWNKKLPRIKLKFDFFNFKQHPGDCKDGKLERLHFENLRLFIKTFNLSRISISLGVFLNRLENDQSLNWSCIFRNPLFLQSKQEKIEWNYWKITEKDRSFTKSLKEKEIDEEEFTTAVHKIKKPVNMKDHYIKSEQEEKKSREGEKNRSSKVLSRTISMSQKTINKKDLMAKKILIKQIDKYFKTDKFQNSFEKNELSILEGWLQDKTDLYFPKTSQAQFKDHAKKAKEIFTNSKIKISDIKKLLKKGDDFTEKFTEEDFELLIGK